ncbi:MAG: GNAT family N-acetyltransferase [Deltaproteobacteria bacterium]|nr:GNAT family N-acetyltransferase [Deltaproteobacteria bacterium]
MSLYSWKDIYQQKRTEVQSALMQVRNGNRIFIGSACGEPQYLVRELAKRANELMDTEVIHLLTMGKASYTKERFDGHLRLKSFFIGDSVREAVGQGRADLTPTRLSEIPKLFTSGQILLDEALIQVSPPDEHGFMSYGISVDITKPAAESARIIIAQVNRHMPRTLGDSFIHVSRVNHIVEYDEPLVEAPPAGRDEVFDRIGHHIAKLIDDGATIQTGIGRIPNAVLAALKEKRDLGVHTEMFTDSLIELVESGAVTNRRKTLHPGKIIASFCMGSPRLYQFVNNNPLVEFHPSQYTNNPYIISRNRNMISINGAIEIDLTGQVCADSLGYVLYSGLGGHQDFVRGAARSEGGKPIIAFPSTARECQTSRIVPHLAEGAGVVTSRGDVHYVVTEYGVAYLHGKSIRERAMALINIAHPDFRSELLAAAKHRHYVYPDQMLPAADTQYPEQWETTHYFDGQPVFFRPIKPTDERMLQDLFYSLSDETIYKRFLTFIKSLPHSTVQKLVNIDYKEMMAVVGLVGEPEKEQIIAVGRYRRDSQSNMGEVSLLVHEQWQNKGIGKYLLTYLIDIARSQGIKGFTAEILAENEHMLHVLYKIGYTVKSRLAFGIYSIEFLFDEIK